MEYDDDVHQIETDDVKIDNVDNDDAADAVVFEMEPVSDPVLRVPGRWPY